VSASLWGFRRAHIKYEPVIANLANCSDEAFKRDGLHQIAVGSLVVAERPVALLFRRGEGDPEATS